MKLEDCKICKYHSGAMFDNIACRKNGATGYHVVARDKKGVYLVLECPLETEHVTRKASEWYKTLHTLNNPSQAESIK